MKASKQIKASKQMKASKQIKAHPLKNTIKLIDIHLYKKVKPLKMSTFLV
jgi:hypothetical protein